MGIYPLSLSQVSTVFAVVGAVVTLLLLSGSIIAVIGYSRKDNIEKKQAEWIKQLRDQLDYVEPRLKDALAANKVMRDLLNPTEMIESNTAKVISAIEGQRAILESIDRKVGEGHDG